MQEAYTARTCTQRQTDGAASGVVAAAARKGSISAMKIVRSQTGSRYHHASTAQSIHWEACWEAWRPPKHDTLLARCRPSAVRDRQSHRSQSEHFELPSTAAAAWTRSCSAAWAWAAMRTEAAAATAPDITLPCTRNSILLHAQDS